MEHMDTSLTSDALALWSDVLDLTRENKDIKISHYAMLQNCKPYSLEDNKLYISAPSRFIRLQIEKLTPLIENYLKQISYEDIKFVVTANVSSTTKVQTSSVISQEELLSLSQEQQYHQPQEQRVATPQEQQQQLRYSQQSMSTQGIDTQTPTQMLGIQKSIEERRAANPLIDDVTENDSKLTFSRFVTGEENMLALQAAKCVADGVKNYNPLFIYGRSGLGKTHLLKAIQNYIVQNKIEKLCVYRVSHDFVSEYVRAMSDTSAEVKEAFRRNYRDIDILIIDDIQFLKGPGSVGFFFDLFNYLVDHGKQIVLAADESPAQLGIGNVDFDERLVSRLDSGFACPIKVPDYDLKLALITNFYNRAKEDAISENLPGYEGVLSDECLQLMAERAGSNIRVIESFCQSCLLEATKLQQKGEDFRRENIIKLATQKFGTTHRIVTIDQIIKAIEDAFHISHSDLVGSTRKKEIMGPRQIGCYLAREMTDLTLADIGKRFGGRSHATISYSITETEKNIKESRLLYDQISQIKDTVLNG